MRSCTGIAGLLSGILFLCLGVAKGQGLYPISTEQKVNKSSLIVEGKVIKQSAEWNSRHTMIYTTNKVEVYKVFKGTLTKNVVDVVTVGGAVDGYYIHASHLLVLKENDLGVFFLTPSSNSPSGGSKFNVYSSQQGFLKYDPYTNSASAPFAQFENISTQLYTELSNRTGKKPEIRNPYFSLEKETKKIVGNNSVLAPSITGFSPATVHAGAFQDTENNRLTITGSGFGASPGGSAAVLFTNADNPGGAAVVVAYNSEFVVSWNDNTIVLKVPTNAGTGPFRVRDNAGTTTNSPTNLQVLFSVLTAPFGGSYGTKQFTLGNMNGSGGYSIKYSTSTAAGGINVNTSQAKATFQRALNTWKESVGVNFVEAGTSTLQVVDPDDNENLVMYDNGNTGLDDPLGDGVLATCFSGVTICTNDPVANQARKTGFDIVIRNSGFSTGNIAFTLGPCPPYSQPSSVVDLESVLLHELGHALNLGHIIDPLQGSGAGTATPGGVMHYSVAYNQRRISVDYAAKVGGEFQVNPHSYTYGTCVVGTPEMTPLSVVLEPKDECPVTFPAQATAVGGTINFDLAHSTSNKFTDPSYTQMTLDGTGTNITNTAYYAIRTNQAGGTLNLEVKNYTTSPAAIAECPVGGTGINVSGVKLSVYKTNDCPDGGEFPTPVAYLVFDENGELPAINNLTGNSTYLLVLDGIQNTKAIFDITFTGNALATQATSLTGAVQGEANKLTWVTDPSFGATDVILERSADGIDFDTVQLITGSAQLSGEFSDASPLPGTNYYRLKLIDDSGNIQYSEVVLLNRIDDFQVNIFPYPANSQINVEIISFEPGRYGISVFNALGMRVALKQINVTTRKHTEVINSSAFMSGVFYVSVYDANNKRIRSATVKVGR